ncbi:hypothetical protein [Vibrio atlanticus]|uniref:hypothetical protein n=1 Tax=Vibrio atlanticus TaxID=693153 RepID=UPI0022B04893|nr:hypothetical protein [Vibrio atlanticus]MCZ4310307.1 hypothetical protein [Vibrio atlanticus]
MSTTKYLYDPFTPVFPSLTEAPKGRGYVFETRLKAPVRRVKIFSHEVWLPKGVGFNPSTKELYAKKNRNSEQILNESVRVHATTSKTDVAKLIIKLVNSLFTLTDSLPETESTKTVNYSVCLKTPKKPTQSPALSVVTNISGQKPTHRDIALSSLGGVDDALQVISWTRDQLEDYSLSLEQGNPVPFTYDRSKEIVTSLTPSNTAIYTNQLETAFERYTENAGLQIEVQDKSESDSWGKFAPFIDTVNYTITQARQIKRVENNNEIKTEKFHTQPHKTSGVVGVLVSLARRELNLQISAITGKTSTGSFQIKRFTLSKYPLKKAFELAKKAYLDAFSMPHPTTYQMNLEYDQFRAALVRTLPSELFYQTGNALEGMQVVKPSKPVRMLELSKEEITRLKAKKAKAEGKTKKAKTKKKVAKPTRIKDEISDVPDVAIDEVATSTETKETDLDCGITATVEEPVPNIDELMAEAEFLIKERLQLRSKHSRTLDVLRDGEFGFTNFGDLPPTQDIQLADCQSCSSPATVTEEKGMYRCHCTKCTKQGALVPSLWRASLDWNSVNTLSIKVTDIPHFHLYGRSIENSYLYLENIEPLIVVQDELCQIETELALLQRKYKLDLGTRYQKPGKNFKESIEAYRYWFNITFEVVNRYRLVGRAWNK